ncbi:MAG: hypothetical protein H0W83_03640 [Planctomycetes bacterium]|nr:hypothetical protein [Planctomycetota bacterium]
MRGLLILSPLLILLCVSCGGPSQNTQAAGTASATGGTTASGYDLVPLALTNEPDVPTTGNFSLHFTVYDASSDSQGALNVGWRILQDGAALPASAGDVSGVIASLPGNTAVDIVAQLGGVSAGTHQFTVEVDAENSHAEYIETNNRAQLTASITAPAGAPARDLFVSGAHANPTSPMPNAVSVTFAIVNVDPTQADGIPWSVSEGGVVIASGTAATVPANGQTSITAGPFSAAIGAHTYVVTVDPANLIAESSETNNTETVTLTVRDPSVAPTDVDVFPVAYHLHPNRDVNGNLPQNLEIHFWVYYRSPSGQPPINVAWHISMDGALMPSGMNYGGFRGVLNNLPANTSGVGVGEGFSYLTNIPIGPHVFKVVVDPANLITEDDEANNIGSDMPAVITIAYAG